MASYDRNFTDELHDKLSIVDIVSKKVPLTKKGQNFWGCCPFHNEKTPSFSVNESKGFYHCFGCGEHGDIISFLMKTSNIDFVTAIKELANIAGLKIPETRKKTVEEQKFEDIYTEITSKATEIFQKKLYSEEGKHALNYIHNRGFSDEVIKKYKIGYAPKNNFLSNNFVKYKQSDLLQTGLVRHGDFGIYDFFRDKLMFPIFNSNGKIVAFSGRSLDGSEPKYINTSDTALFHKKQIIFGFNFARDSIYKANRTIIVEGQIDTIQMQTHGFGETVAPLGTALTEEHLSILCKSNRNIIFCFDGDKAGIKAASRACSLVIPFIRDNSEIKFAFITGGSDPDDILKNQGQNSMKKIIDTSTPLIDFLWKIANTNYLVSTPAGKTQAEKFLQTEINKITDPKLKYEYEQEFNIRKFNTWHKWQKNKKIINIDIPNVDDITKKTLSYIIDNYPEISEKYAEFLNTLNIKFDKNYTNIKISEENAEKFLISLKLKLYIQKLQKERAEVVSNLLKGDKSFGPRLKQIDIDLDKNIQKYELLYSL